MLPSVVECGGPDEVVDVILYEEVEHGIITRCTDPEGNVVAEIDLMQTAIVRYDDSMLVRVRRHSWAWRVAKAVWEHASTEEDDFVGDKPVKKTVDAEGWSCRYRVRVDWT
jgi:hypothetical protein